MGIRSRIFALTYDRMTAETERAFLAGHRAALLKDATGRVLEIGGGTGANLVHYGPGVEALTVTEPEPAMLKRLRRRAEEVAPTARVLRAASTRRRCANCSPSRPPTSASCCTAAGPAAGGVGGGRLVTPPPPTPRDIACQELVELLTEHLEDALPADEVAAIDHHLAACDACLRYLRQLRATVVAMGMVPTEQVTETLSEPTLATLLDAFQQRR